MAVLPYIGQNYYNTICLDNLRVGRTQVINVIKYKLLLYLVKIGTTIIKLMIEFISRKPCFFYYKESSETMRVNSCLIILFFE